MEGPVRNYHEKEHPDTAVSNTPKEARPFSDFEHEMK